MEEKVINEAVVCFLVNKEKISLAFKKAKIGKGFLNGYGGGVEKGESEIGAVLREVFEETGGVVVYPKGLKKIAIANFVNTKIDGTDYSCLVHFYLSYLWFGGAVETKEMGPPNWFSIKDLPLDKLMPADRFWLPEALGGKNLFINASYGPEQKTLIGDVDITEISLF